MKTELTQEQKRIKIAEACGWICSADYGSEKFFHKGDPLRAVMWPDSSHHAKLPDYFNDLNAIVDSVRNHMAQDEDIFASELAVLVIGRKPVCELDMAIAFVGARPEQWAEAFGKTLGLW